MEKMKKQITTLLVCSIILSIMFPTGIVGIILGATKGISPMIIISAVMTGFCFYAVPIMWTSFGSKKQQQRVLSCVEVDRFENVQKISSATQLSKDEVANTIKLLISKGYLHGYAFDGEKLQPIEEGKLKTISKSGKIKCPNCGATYQAGDKNDTCPYCGS